MRAEIQALRAEQARINELSRVVEMKLQVLEARAGASPAVASDATPVAKPAATDRSASEPSRLTVTGDLRLRSQGDYADSARDRQSAQVRGRLGANYKVNDTITLGGRLATGDPDDPNSSDVQLSNFDDDLEFALDQAYAQFDLGDLRLYGGKIPQPFTRTDLVWDGDVNPQGIGAIYAMPVGGSVLTFSGLYFLVDHSVAGSDSSMLGAQLSVETPLTKDIQLGLSAAQYDYSLPGVAGADAGDFRSNLIGPDGHYLSDFDLTDVIVSMTFRGWERWPVRLTGEYVRNGGARTPG